MRTESIERSVGGPKEVVTDVNIKKLRAKLQKDLK